MKTIYKIFFIVILITYIPSKCIAQDHTDNRTGRKMFVSIHSGAYFPSVSGFNTVYHSPCAFINGISLGFPFTNKELFFYVKGMYSQKSGNPITYHFEYDELTGELTNTYTTQENDVIITWHQWLGNVGIQYNLGLGLTNNLIFNGGISLVKASEKTKDSSVGSDSGGLGLFGYFFGIGYEKRISKKFGLFTEAQYNFDLPILRKLGINYGGANFNLGIRYYF
jgi:hypothetical protein